MSPHFHKSHLKYSGTGQIPRDGVIADDVAYSTDVSQPPLFPVTEYLNYGDYSPLLDTNDEARSNTKNARPAADGETEALVEREGLLRILAKATRSATNLIKLQLSNPLFTEGKTQEVYQWYKTPKNE